MAQPRDYTRQYNFKDFQATSPSSPLPGTEVDAELNSVKLTLDDLNANIAKVQRDDGKLGNTTVHKDAFDQGALAIINSTFTPRGIWATASSYVVNDAVDFNGATYVATVAHTSSAAFATDTAASRWLLIANAALAGTSSSVDKFEGNGSTTAFTLSNTYASETSFFVFVNGELLNPVDDYTLSGTTLTLYTAPGFPVVAGNENLIVWGSNVVAQASQDAAEAAESNASGFADESESWATKTSGIVESTDYSSKAWSIGGTGVDAGSGSSKDWATKTGGTVGNTGEYSAKYWATSTPVTTVAGIAGNVTTVAGIASDVTTVSGLSANVTTVAGDSADVQTVAGRTVQLGILGTVDAVADMNTLAPISGNITTVANNDANVTTVAGIAANVTTVAGNTANVTTVAGISSDVTAVAGKASFITADFVSDLNTLAVTDVIADINLLATSDIVSDLNTLATSDIVSDLNTLAASDIVSDINLLATNDIVGDLNLLATSDFVSDLNTMATATNVSNLNTVSGAVSNVNTVAGISANVTTVAGISSAVTTVAADGTDIGVVSTNINNVNAVAGNSTNINAVVANATNINAVASDATDIGVVSGISANVSTVAANNANVTTVAGISGNVTTVAGIAANVTAVAGDAADIGTVATDLTGSNTIGTVAGSISNVNSVGGAITNVNTVATNINSVNDFADKYRIGATDPSTNNDEGDLFYNTTSDSLKVYTGSAWEQGVTAGSGFLPLTGGGLTGDLTFSGTQTVDGRDLSIDGGKLDGVESGATADQTKADIDALNINADLLDGQHGAYYTGYTDTAVAGLVDSSPATLDTLNELAAALGDDPNFATTTAASIGTKLPKSGGAMTGAITTNSTFDGRNVSVDGAKLDTIATSANNYSFPYTVSTLESNSTVVQRNSSGYVNAAYFNGTGTFATSGASSGMGNFTGNNGGDTYGRSYNATAARALLNVANGATNVTNNNQLTNGAGYTTYTSNQATNTNNNVTFEAVTCNGPLYVMWNDNSSDIYMQDTDEGSRRIHCNSNKIGFLTQGGSWGSYCNDDGSWTSDSYMTSPNFNTTSDATLKTNVETITAPLDKVKALRGVTFDWIESGDSEVGLIAQEVEAIVPDVVSTNKEGIKSVKYSNMVGLLIEAIKEQQVQIDALTAKLNG